jgi:hypothetical protein
LAAPASYASTWSSASVGTGLRPGIAGRVGFAGAGTAAGRAPGAGACFAWQPATRKTAPTPIQNLRFDTPEV